MKKYLFRAYCVPENKWYYRNIDVQNSFGQDEFLDEESFSLFSGLVDGNGVKIFEGDVVSVFSGFGENNHQIRRIALVVFENSFFKLKLPRCLLPYTLEQYCNSMSNLISIIGNIYEGRFKHLESIILADDNYKIYEEDWV